MKKDRLPRRNVAIRCLTTRDPLHASARVKWLQMEAIAFAGRSVRKFMKGAKRHRHDIGERDIAYLFNAIEEEVIDLLMYLHELKRRAGNLSRKLP